jgi:hypothetical protein
MGPPPRGLLLDGLGGWAGGITARVDLQQQRPFCIPPWTKREEVPSAVLLMRGGGYAGWHRSTGSAVVVKLAMVIMDTNGGGRVRSR